MLLPPEILLQKMVPVFQERGVSMTYQRYLRTDRDGNENVDVFADDFTITALTGQRIKWATDASGPVKIESYPRSAIWRTTDLPTGVEPKDLTLNDRVVYLGKTLSVTKIRIADPFIHCALEGS